MPHMATALDTEITLPMEFDTFGDPESGRAIGERDPEATASKIQMLRCIKN